MNKNVHEELVRIKQDIAWMKKIILESKQDQEQIGKMISDADEILQNKEIMVTDILRKHLSADIFHYFCTESLKVDYAVCQAWYETENRKLKRLRKESNSKAFCGLTMTLLSAISNIPVLKEGIQNLLSIIPTDNLERTLVSLTLVCALYTLKELKQLEKTDSDWQDLQALEKYFRTSSDGLKKKREL
ncbi:MAG: hypothetical protein HFI09_03695 [Bacilli bacterium]|nr:hypothetical protein [Bacilli bacterium]